MSPHADYVHEPSETHRLFTMRQDEDREQLALGEAMLALANLDRAIRHLPVARSASDMHCDSVTACLKAARVTAMAQHPSARLNAVAAASEELRHVIDGLITDPTAAVVNDPERMKDACQAMVRNVIDTYQKALWDALPAVRAEQSAAVVGR